MLVVFCNPLPPSYRIEMPQEDLHLVCRLVEGYLRCFSHRPLQIDLVETEIVANKQTDR